jgi:hypothetical protein
MASAINTKALFVALLMLHPTTVDSSWGSRSLSVPLTVLDVPAVYQKSEVSLSLAAATADLPIRDIEEALLEYPASVLENLVDRVVIGTKLTVVGSDLVFYGYAMCSDARDRTLFLSRDRLDPRSSASGMKRTRNTVHHEMGHAVFCALDESQREEWRAKRVPRSPADAPAGPACTYHIIVDWLDARPSEEFARYVELILTDGTCLDVAACLDAAVADKTEFVRRALAAAGIDPHRPAQDDCAV